MKCGEELVRKEIGVERTEWNLRNRFGFSKEVVVVFVEGLAEGTYNHDNKNRNKNLS